MKEDKDTMDSRNDSLPPIFKVNKVSIHTDNQDS